MNCDVPALWQEHKDALYYFILKRVQDKNQAKDIAQDVLLKVYDFCCCKSGIQNVRAWLFQIAHNTIVDHYRKNNRISLIEEPLETQEESDDSAFREAAEFILPMINLLPETYAIPLRMSDVEGLKLKIIADELGLGLSAVKKRVSRARTMLKEVFTECCLMELDNQGRLINFDIRPGCKPLENYRASLKK